MMTLFYFHLFVNSCQYGFNNSNRETISLEFDEFNSSFIERLKALFVNSTPRLTIAVEDKDETDYLLKSDANREILMKFIQEAQKGDFVVPNLGKFRELIHA